MPHRWLGRLLIAGLAACAPFSPQTQKLTASVFPDPAPQLDVPTPAFAKKTGFTQHDELIAFLDTTIPAKTPGVEVRIIGQSQAGRDIPLVHLSATEEPRVRVWFQGGLHGNEPASSEGMLLLLHRLMNDPKIQELRRFADIAIVPTANVDGYHVGGRYARNGLDLNRDQTKLNVPESLLLRRALIAFDPHVAVDFHEYRPYRRDFVKLGANGVTGVYDVMFLYSGNLNVPEPLRTLTQSTFVQPARDAMDAHGLTHHDYVTTRTRYGDIQFSQGSTNARSSATSLALSNTISSLIEVRGVGVGRQGFDRRVKTTFWVAESYLRSAVTHHEAVRQALAANPGAVDPITLNSEGKVGTAPLEFWDLHTHERSSLDVVVHDNLRSTSTLTRPRPGGWILLPQASALMERLDVLGIACVPVTGPERQVQRYVVTDVKRAAQRYEGVRRQSIKVGLESENRAIPNGSCLVKADQRRGALAAEVLEPDAPNSFVSFGVVRTDVDEELPYYRIPAATPPTAAPASPQTTPGGSP